jgi:hypothetical protein
MQIKNSLYQIGFGSLEVGVAGRMHLMDGESVIERTTAELNCGPLGMVCVCRLPLPRSCKGSSNLKLATREETNETTSS